MRVAETDPVRALEARHDGFRTGRALESAGGALVVSATGVPATVTPEIAAVARVVAVAGAFRARSSRRGPLCCWAAGER